MWSSSPVDQPGAPPPVAADVFGTGLETADRYARLLASTAVRRGLLGPREARRLWERHLLNCAVIGELIPPDADVVDVGSGAGLPGIPLAIARPDLRLMLLEPMERRCVFLREVVAELGLAARVGVYRGRAPEAASEGVSSAVAVSRAVAPLGRLTLWTMPLLPPGGVMLAVRGARAGGEVLAEQASVRAAGGRDVEVLVCGRGLPEPTTVVRVVRDGTSRRGRRSRTTRTGGTA